MRFPTRRSIAATLAAAVTLTSLNLAPAQAAAADGTGQSQVTHSSAVNTELSARRRHYNRGNAAALGAVLGVFGAIAAVAAADRYRDNYYYGGGPYYGPYGYGAPYGYAPVYPYRYGHHHHRHWR